MENKRDNKIKGGIGEDTACRYLTAHGFTVMARNFFCPTGEVDIVALKGDVLHFVEVKSRTGGLIPGRTAVGAAKQKRIKNTAAFFLKANGLADKCFCSFDVIEITNTQIDFLENCFY